MRYLLLILLMPLFGYGQQDSCVVFSPEINNNIKVMGLYTDPPTWKNINYVVHVHYTDSFPNSILAEDIIYDADDHLNEEFEEAMFSFDLVTIQYHNFDNFWMAPVILASNGACAPYTGSIFYGMQEYLEEVQWDNEIYMNVHVFPEFCQGILGFAWTSYIDNSWDGVWVRTDVFGRIGEHISSPRDENKTLIHEVGHYVSLHHVFRNVEFCGQDLGYCETTGDFVCDTPPTKLNWSCENPVCPPGLYDYTPNNHMDYYVDSCRTNFTAGQIQRMHNMLPITRPNIIDTDDDVCIGDINGDYVVGMNDLLLILQNWENIYWEEGDVSGDGFFTVIDVQIVLAQWGTICFGAELDPFYREEKHLVKTESVKSLLDLLNEYGSNATRSN